MPSTNSMQTGQHIPVADYARAQRLLQRRDPVLRRLIREHGPCTLRPEANAFAVLTRAIVAQQISTKAAASITARLKNAMGRRGLVPRAIAAASDQTLRAVGLSAGKMRALRDLADKTLTGDVALAELPKLDDEEVIARLLPVHGIGRWTAEMFLIFCLGRLDVLPLADLGLRAGIQRHYELTELPDKAGLISRAEAWRPYRTVATWFFWRSFGNVPQSY